jgi:hypothetical protein
LHNALRVTIDFRQRGAIHRRDEVIWIILAGATKRLNMTTSSYPLADRYFAAMRARDVEALMALFAEDAVMVLPDGRELAGSAAIRAMYDYLVASGAPSPTPTAAIAGTDGVAVEIEARLVDGSTRQTANFFHLDGDGLIRRLSVYGRG